MKILSHQIAQHFGIVLTTDWDKQINHAKFIQRNEHVVFSIVLFLSGGIIPPPDVDY